MKTGGSDSAGASAAIQDDLQALRDDVAAMLAEGYDETTYIEVADASYLYRAITSNDGTTYKASRVDLATDVATHVTAAAPVPADITTLAYA